jgi:ParB family chromosome partitioning protein
MAPDKLAENSGKQKIAIDRIRPRPLNCNQLDDEVYNGLKEDIKRNGLRYPIHIRPIGPDSYEIVDGEHRWRAAQELGWKEIECQVEELSEEEADIANFTLNPERQRNPAIAGQIFNRLRMKGHTQESIAKIFGITQARVSQCLEIVEYPEEIKDLITSRLITLEHARKIVGMLPDPKLQVQVANKVVEGRLSVRKAEAVIRALLELKRRAEQWERRKVELLGIMDFSARHGPWKSERCKHRDEEGYCIYWSWSDEPLGWKEELPWLEMRQIEGKWFSKASSNVCALCDNFRQEADEADRLQARIMNLEAWVYGPLKVLSSACMEHGELKRDNCSHYVGGYCRYWHWTSKPTPHYMQGEPAVEPDGKWRINPDPQYCATCPRYYKSS